MANDAVSPCLKKRNDNSFGNKLLMKLIVVWMIAGFGPLGKHFPPCSPGPGGAACWPNVSTVCCDLFLTNVGTLTKAVWNCFDSGIMFALFFGQKSGA